MGAHRTPSGGPRLPTGRSGSPRHRTAGGFTLIELLVVVALIAIASATVTLALRDPAATTLDREGVRLAALLESARAEARASGVPARFELRTRQNERSFEAGDGAGAPFRFVGLPDAARVPARFLDEGTSAELIGASALVLGPEPILPAQRLVLRLGNHRLLIETDGLGPFRVAASGQRDAP